MQLNHSSNFGGRCLTYFLVIGYLGHRLGDLAHDLLGRLGVRRRRLGQLAHDVPRRRRVAQEVRAGLGDLRKDSQIPVPITVLLSVLFQF